VLGRLEPRLAGVEDRATLNSEVTQAQLNLDGTRAEQARADRLFAERAVPARRVEDAKRAVAAAEARLNAAQARLEQRDQTLRSGGSAASGNAFALQAPIRGRVIAVSATIGASYDEGAPLFRILRTDRVALRVDVPVAEASIARRISEVGFEIPGRTDLIPLQADEVHNPGTVDSSTGALALILEIRNPGSQLLVGQRGTAVLFTNERSRLTAVPQSALLLEAGRAYVWVQVGGERFARRYVEVAARDGDWVGVTGGVANGERVVTRGAYDVQLASAAKGLPAEGHVH
jgi:RND family efflux transporter MFP subunit